MDLKIENWAAFWGMILGSLMSFVSPVLPFLALAFVLILFDLYTGIKAAKIKGTPITSSGIKRTIEKITLYFAYILILEGIKIVFFSGFSGDYIGWIAEMPITYIGSFVIILAEMKSADENFKVIRGYSIYDKISQHIKFNYNGKKEHHTDEGSA